MDAKYKLFRKGAVVVDLVCIATIVLFLWLTWLPKIQGYAPGSWSQVAKDRAGPKGLVVGIDLIPAQPPRGVSTIQGNFLSPAVRNLVKTFVAEGAARKQIQQLSQDTASNGTANNLTATVATSDDLAVGGGGRSEEEDPATEGGKDDVVLVEQTSYIDAERLAARDAVAGTDKSYTSSETEERKNVREERLVDVCFFLTLRSSSW